MADAIYEVNIKLDAQQFEQELNQLKGKLKKFEKEAKERNKKDPIFRRGRELTVLKSIESTRNKLNELDRFGLETAKRRNKLDKAEQLAKAGKFQTAKNLVKEAQLLTLQEAESLRLAKERVAEEKRIAREKWQKDNFFIHQVFGFEFESKEFNRAMSLKLNHYKIYPNLLRDIYDVYFLLYN